MQVKYDFPVKLAHTSDQNTMIVGDSQVLKNIKTESISKLTVILTFSGQKSCTRII